jgi:16S rRNA A1518/A1519 N6-dimethyltransferase RsmA/KsgA/DIM1 with predicted DNA glycosylase/AP lyase activity
VYNDGLINIAVEPYLYIMHRKIPLGQHFLKEVSIAREIAQRGTADDPRTVFEIGPGEGVLTTELLGLSKRVIKYT